MNLMTPPPHRHDFVLDAGTMRVAIDPASALTDPDPVFDLASRLNRKRGFLIVSKLIGRHLPTRPQTMRETMAALAGQLPDLGDGPVLFIGMAETAVGLGQGVHAAWTRDHEAPALFLSTTRQTAPDLDVLLRFEEAHSHASTHIVHVPIAAADRELIDRTTTLVLIDDEASTGLTMDALEAALRARLPALQRAWQLVIADWTDSRPGRLSLMRGAIEWIADDAAGFDAPAPTARLNRPGDTLAGASAARTGYRRLVRDMPPLPALPAASRVVVLADGENGYDALLIAERLEAEGHRCVLQSITRSPAALGGAMTSRHAFSDSHGSGAPCFAYNLFLSDPDAIVCVVERVACQRAELEAAARDAARSVSIHVVEVSK